MAAIDPVVTRCRYRAGRPGLAGYRALPVEEASNRQVTYGYDDRVPGALNLVTIQTTQWPDLVRWYEEVLQLTVVTRDEADRFAMLVSGDGGAMLAIASDHPEQANRRGENRVAPGFLVADLDAKLIELRSLGVRTDPVIDGEAEGYRLARIWDPDGNRLHLYTYG